MIDLFLAEIPVGLRGFDRASTYKNRAVQIATEPALVNGYGHFYSEQLIAMKPISSAAQAIVVG